MGVFIKQDNQWVLCKEIKEGGSTNDDLQALGYEPISSIVIPTIITQVIMVMIVMTYYLFVLR